MKNPLPWLRCFVSCLSFTALGVCAQDYGINYTFSQPTTSLTYNNSSAGSVSLIAGGTDDQLVSFPAPATWGGFYFAGVWYPQDSTTIYVSSNGWLSIQKPGDPIPPSSLPTNSLASNPYRIIAPLWDDLKVHNDGEVTYALTGNATTRALVIEWRGMYWDHNGLDSAISFQAILYDNAQAIVANRNAIEFRYKRNGNDTAYVNNSSGGASIGISGFCTNDVFAFSSVIGQPSKSSPEISSISSKPADAGTYRFRAVAHANDECATAQLLTFNPALPLFSSVGTTLRATQSVGTLPSCGTPATTNDVWYTFIKPTGITNFEIFTDSLDCRGLLFATGVEIFSTCGGIPYACDFGSPGPPGTNASSYLDIRGLPCSAQQYWVRVFSADTSYRGYFRFNIRPPGRDCAYRSEISACGIPFSSSNLTTCNFGNEYDSATAVPHTQHMSGADYDFSITPSASICVDFSLTNTPANSNPGLYIYLGCPNNGTCIGSVTGFGGTAITINNVSLIAGLTYHFLVDNDTAGATGCLSNFDFAITPSTAVPAANDICSAASNIPVVTSATCTGVIDYNNNCTSPTGAGLIPLPGCGDFTDGVTPDVWFTFTSTSTSVHQIKIDNGTSPSANDLAMAVYTGSCGALSLVNCDDNSNGLMPLLAVVPPAAGTPYYVRVWSNNGTQTGNFRICVADGCSAPNDFCAGAIPLTVGQYAQGDNSCATGINEPLADTSATCWTNNGGSVQLNTVWYSFLATDDTMKIRTHLLTLFDSQIALYSSSGGCGGTFTELFCNDNAPAICTAGINRNSQIIATGLTVGTTYFIRVDGVNANTGTFQIIVLPESILFPAIYAQDCPLAIGLCNNSTISVPNPGYQGSGNICDVLPGNSTCLANGETQSVFYTFSVTGTGAGTPVEFTITPNASGDYNFMLWCIDTVYGNGDQIPAVPNYCSMLNTETSFMAAVCNYSSQGITGCNVTAGLCPIPCYSNSGSGASGFSPAVVVPNGMTATFLLLVNSDSYLNGFSLDWMGTPINGNPSYLTWQGGNNSNWSDSSNWNAGACGEVPDCINQIGAIIASSAVMPVISSNTSVSDLTINAGATLTISPGVRLDVCGNFVNNGLINCGAGSTVRFIGSRNTFIGGSFNSGFNNFYNVEVAKDSGATLFLNTNLYVMANDSVFRGIMVNNSFNTEVGGNFYNYDGNSSFTITYPGTITFTLRSTRPQHFRNDGSALTLANVVMNQITAGGSLTLDTNATSDLKLGFNGSLTLTSGRIITGTSREVNITNTGAAACSAGNTLSYVEGNLRRAIGTFASTYDFPVGDATHGYQRFATQFTQAPPSSYNILARFRPWIGMPSVGPVVNECGNNGWDLMPPFDNGYWTLDASITSGIGIYNANAYPLNAANNVGATFSIMKSASNNGQGPWMMEGFPFCPGTAVHSERDGLSTFSDFAVVQSDIGNYIMSQAPGNSGFTFFPNPAAEKITLAFYTDDTGEFVVHLKDVTGRIILTENIKTAKGINSKEINLQGISKGVYLLSLENKKSKEAAKLILQ